MTPTIITIRRIAEVTADLLGLERASLCGDTRCQQIVRARHIAWYVANRCYGHSLARIGQRFRRHHTTVMHGVRLIEARLRTDAELQQAVASIRAALDQHTITRPVCPAPSAGLPECAPPAEANKLVRKAQRDWWQEQNDRFVAAMRQAHPEREIALRHA
ncbi:MAG TPA: helix-turn-helix domain-containing protein [Hyphomicrobiaceae bacterium]|nr:helix-turn-helix domain-containing protein [Hyphomicrobiaceae bacterium]